MSNYTRNQIIAFVKNSLSSILPLDKYSISDMITYCSTNLKTRAELKDYFTQMLGQSEEIDRFTNQFYDILHTQAPAPVPSSLESSASDNAVKKSGTKSVKLVSTNGSRTKIVRTKVVNKTSDGKVIPSPSSAQRLKGNTFKGSTTSDLLDLTPKRKEKIVIKKQADNQKVKNIAEIEEILSKIEVMNSLKNDIKGNRDIRVCNCMATKHPLFEMYPNCLNCGKIICEREGPQPCSFCGTPLMTEEESEHIKELLLEQKEQLIEEPEDKTTAKPKGKKKNVMKISLGNVGQNNFKVQEQFYKMVSQQDVEKVQNAKQEEEEKKQQKFNEDEIKYWNEVKDKDPELVKAEERLEMLLNFQDNGTERTKIIDNAADFESPLTSGSLWASPLERALQLKRQQKQAQRLDELEKQRTGRGEVKVDLIIENGKAIMRRTNVEDSFYEEDNLSDDEDIKEMKKQARKAAEEKQDSDVLPYYDYNEISKSYVKPTYLGEAVGQGGKNEETTGGSVVQVSPEEAEEAFFRISGI